jgi:hypothetical protein
LKLKAVFLDLRVRSEEECGKKWPGSGYSCIKGGKMMLGD